MMSNICSIRARIIASSDLKGSAKQGLDPGRPTYRNIIFAILKKDIVAIGRSYKTLINITYIKEITKMEEEKNHVPVFYINSVDIHHSGNDFLFDMKVTNPESWSTQLKIYMSPYCFYRPILTLN